MSRSFLLVVALILCGNSEARNQGRYFYFDEITNVANNDGRILVEGALTDGTLRASFSSELSPQYNGTPCLRLARIAQNNPAVQFFVIVHYADGNPLTGPYYFCGLRKQDKVAPQASPRGGMYTFARISQMGWGRFGRTYVDGWTNPRDPQLTEVHAEIGERCIDRAAEALLTPNRAFTIVAYRTMNMLINDRVTFVGSFRDCELTNLPAAP